MWLVFPKGKPVGIKIAGEDPSSSGGTVRVGTPGVTLRVKKGNQTVIQYKNYELAGC